MRQPLWYCYCRTTFSTLPLNCFALAPAPTQAQNGHPDLKAPMPHRFKVPSSSSSTKFSIFPLKEKRQSHLPYRLVCTHDDYWEQSNFSTSRLQCHYAPVCANLYILNLAYISQRKFVLGRVINSISRHSREGGNPQKFTGFPVIPAQAGTSRE